MARGKHAARAARGRLEALEATTSAREVQLRVRVEELSQEVAAQKGEVVRLQGAFIREVEVAAARRSVEREAVAAAEAERLRARVRDLEELIEKRDKQLAAMFERAGEMLTTRGMLHSADAMRMVAHWYVGETGDPFRLLIERHPKLARALRIVDRCERMDRILEEGAWWSLPSRPGAVGPLTREREPAAVDRRRETEGLPPLDTPEHGSS